MKTKQEILREIGDYLRSGAITVGDLSTFLAEYRHSSGPSATNVHAGDKLSAVEVMFYIAGIVLYASLMSAIQQLWGDGAILRILLSAGVGLVLWTIAYILIRDTNQSDIRKGLSNALLLTGSLSVVTGGYIISNELVGGYGGINYVSGAIMLFVVGILHIAFDKYIQRDLTLITGVLLCVSAFPMVMLRLLTDADAPVDIYAILFVATAGLLVYAIRFVLRLLPSRRISRGAFDAFGAFIALGAIYAAIYGDYALVWYVTIFAAIIGIFYVSIVRQNRQLLGSASFFLVVTVLTIAFRHFSGFGITTSLIVATIGLLGSAAVAAGVNKKYFGAAS